MDNLLFANIPHSCKDDDLRTWIEERGFKVSALKMIRDVVAGSSPSFAQVQLAASPVSGGAIQALDRQSFGDCRIYVRRGRSPIGE